uniref:BV1 n=1 Tax=Gossypium punctatum mild leaf curl virus [Gossypium mustelinum] TaxID=632115 RepID=C9W965_9GEMI|nr:BV1 [Gossypium punctatum mild leaf curl virus [Gossypium mustelinum]]
MRNVGYTPVPQHSFVTGDHIMSVSLDRIVVTVVVDLFVHYLVVPCSVMTMHVLSRIRSYLRISMDRNLLYVTIIISHRTYLCLLKQVPRVITVWCYIKLVNISFTGTVCIKNSQMESDGSPMLGLHGLFTCVLVRDKTPRVYSTTEPLIPFPQLFGSINASCADLSIQEPYKDRFAVLRQVSYPVNTEKGYHMCRFKGSRRMHGKYPIWVSFKDDGGNGDSSGLYTNTCKNAILVYYVWLSDVSSQLDMYCKYVMRYIG